MTFNIHVLESAPVLIYRFVVSELPISSLQICTVLKSFHLSFQFTSICLRGSKVSVHWPCREDVSVTVDQGRNNAPPGTQSEFPYGITGVAWGREWDSRRSFVECWGNDLGLVWLRMKGAVVPGLCDPPVARIVRSLFSLFRLRITFTWSTQAPGEDTPETALQLRITRTDIVPTTEIDRHCGNYYC